MEAGTANSKPRGILAGCFLSPAHRGCGRIVTGLLLLVPCALLSAGVDFSPTAGLSVVRAARAASAHVDILDATMNLTPNAADYTNDYVEVTGASGCRVRLWTNSGTGGVLFVKCADAAPRIALADFLVKTQTAPGPGGTSMTSYTAVSATDRALWSSAAAVAMWGQVNVDIRIKNLFAYPDALGAGTTNYTNNLTFTLVMQ
jgi:hypothetical protein